MTSKSVGVTSKSVGAPRDDYLGLNRVKVGRSEGGGGQIINRSTFCETEMSKKEMFGCANRKICTVPLTVEELVGHLSYQLIPRVRTLGLHFSVSPKVNREVEDNIGDKS